MPKTPKKPLGKAVRDRPAAVRHELATIDVLKEVIAGYRPSEIAERLKIPLDDVMNRLNHAFIGLKKERQQLALAAFDVRQLRLDRIIVAFSKDLEAEKPSVRLAAAKEIRETELARDRLLLGAAQVARLEKEVRTMSASEDGGGTKTAQLHFVRRGEERPAHVEPRDTGDTDA